MSSLPLPISIFVLHGGGYNFTSLRSQLSLSDPERPFSECAAALHDRPDDTREFVGDSDSKPPDLHPMQS